MSTAPMTYDLMIVRTLWVNILLATGLILLVLQLALYRVEGMSFSTSLMIQSVIRALGPSVIPVMMLLAILLHIRLVHKAVLILMALYVLFQVLPKVTGFIGHR